MSEDFVSQYFFFLKYFLNITSLFWNCTNYFLFSQYLIYIFVLKMTVFGDIFTLISKLLHLFFRSSHFYLLRLFSFSQNTDIFCKYYTFLLKLYLKIFPLFSWNIQKFILKILHLYNQAENVYFFLLKNLLRLRILIFILTV